MNPISSIVGKQLHITRVTHNLLFSNQQYSLTVSQFSLFFTTAGANVTETLNECTIDQP